MSRIALAFTLLATLIAVPVLSSLASASANAPHERPDVQREMLRAKLVENRAANLERFHAYQKAGVFPSNVYRPGLLNVWKDQDGHFCAAATIIRASGEVALVDAVAKSNNFIKLATVKDGALMDWILTSGFTQEEIVAIQKPFRPVANKPRPAPAKPVTIDPKMRAAETARLAKLYTQIEAKLVADQAASIEIALDRLMARPSTVAALDAH